MKKYILLLAILFIISCGPEPYDTHLKYTIHNDSRYSVELGIFKAYFVNSPITDTYITITSGTEFNYDFYNKSGQEPFGMSSDSAYITFNKTKRLIYKREDNQIRNILDINSWIGGKVGDYLYEYEYFITDEDYENAIEIK
ncbi:MAG: hypothetical protein RBT49_04935 [Bacteroidales bacterium]|jgi:hypothetical protein|nr:hypothetical protein [Bacteroidales bacterium]